MYIYMHNIVQKFESMLHRFYPLFVCLLFAKLALHAQSSSRDAALALEATADTAQLSITLKWPNPSPANTVIKRRKKGQAGNQWTTLLNQANATLSTYIDTSLEKGATYEYVVRRTTTYSSTGFVHVAMLAPVVDFRGKILIFIDSTTADATGVELKKFKDGMRGDGWQTIPIKTGPSSTVQSIKSRIVSEYNADPANVKAVLLIGNVPVPYSGNSAWDGHTDHYGAWPCDNYYADVDGTWTDVSVNNTSPARDANDNVPGDGKFDQSTMPSTAELMVGRIDFRRLDPASFGVSSTADLYNRYFRKNYLWRNGQYRVAPKALVDDNFGYFGGEAFAANGYRNAYPLVEAFNVVNGDFLTDTDTSSYLLGYGCGPGSYTSAAGVGNSTQVAADSINVVFSNIFGSYHGDWDYENNPLMPSTLASRGGILTCSWAGRPHWFMQGLASGEPIGYCALETLRASSNSEYYSTSSYGASGAHVALLGDPTARAQIIAPVGKINAVSTCTAVDISWTASPDTGILGYHVYRSTSLDGPYVRRTANFVNGLSWTDGGPASDTFYYQVRPVRIEHTPGGGFYYNTGVGIIRQHIHLGAPSVTLTAEDPILTCSHPCAQLIANIEAPGQPLDMLVSGPATVDSTWMVCQPGVYSLQVTNLSNGCVATAMQEIDANFNLPIIFGFDVTPVSIPGASDGAISALVPGILYDYLWENGETGAQRNDLTAGFYSVTITNPANGCTVAWTVEVGMVNGTTNPASALEWHIYPNPATAYSSVVPTEKGDEIRIFDANGKLVLHENCSSTPHLLDISALQPGVYVATLYNKGRSLGSRYFAKMEP